MVYSIEKISDLKCLIDYLNDVNEDFGIPLSSKAPIVSFANKLLSFGNVFAIKFNNEIVSCIGFYCNDVINYTAHFTILSTKNSARGKGFARLLTNKMIEECKKNKMRKILCDSINPHAIALYKSVGFIEYKKDGNKIFLEYNIK